MIVVGNVKICERREWVLRHGGILAFIETDRVVRFWIGSGPGVSYLAGEVLAQDGTRFLFGRFRFQVDDNVIFGTSKDTKESFSFAAGPDIPDDVWQGMVTLAIESACMDPMHEIPVDGDVQKFFGLLKSKTIELGASLGITQVGGDQ